MNVSFYTIGCRLNQAETAIIEHAFRDGGYKVVNFNEPADIVVINTCTVTERGDADTRRIISKALRKNDKSKIALVGCQAQTQKRKLFSLPNVQWIVGNEKKMDLPNIIRQTLNEKPQLLTPPVKRASFTIPGAGIDRRHTRANLKIQDGCDYFCSFCEIPFARGRARSRVYNDILREAQELVAAGYKEIILTGVNIGTYAYQNNTLVNIIDKLTEIENLRRIRISSVEGTTIEPALFDRFNNNKKLCRHLHISVQAANNEILKLMNRRYTVQDYQLILNQAATIENICLGTDVIVGFPGETDLFFEESLYNLEKMAFAYFHVFSYSERGHAKSRTFTNKIPRETIEKRSQKMRQLSDKKRAQFLQLHIGHTFPVLFEQKKYGYWTGLTDNYIRVKVKSDENLHNIIANVFLKEIDGQTMIGSFVG